MNRRQSITRALAVVVFGAALAAPAQAQDKPAIRLLVGFPPGGAADTVARLVAEKLRVALAQPVVVENKVGAGGRIAAEALKNSPPDGSTFMIAPNATGIFQALLYPVAELKYDLLNDLAPVAMLTSYPLGMAVATRTGVTNAREYVSWVKSNPREAVFGTAGAGGHTHFTGLQLGKAAGVELTVVPYKGNGPLVSDLLGGQLPAGVLVAGDFIQHQRSGRVRLIGIFSGKRSPLAPDVPTFTEQGYEVATGDAWIGMWASARAPRASIERMEDALGKVLQLADVRDVLATKALMSPDFRPARELDQVQRRELDFWGPVIKASGFKPEQ